MTTSKMHLLELRLYKKKTLTEFRNWISSREYGKRHRRIWALPKDVAAVDEFQLHGIKTNLHLYFKRRHKADGSDRMHRHENITPHTSHTHTTHKHTSHTHHIHTTHTHTPHTHTPHTHTPHTPHTHTHTHAHTPAELREFFGLHINAPLTSYRTRKFLGIQDAVMYNATLFIFDAPVKGSFLIIKRSS